MFQFYLFAVFIGLLLIIENWSLQENQGRFKGASMLVSGIEFIWFLFNLYLVFFSAFPFPYLIIPIAFLLYNVAGWIASFYIIDMPKFDDLDKFDTLENDDKALDAMQNQISEDIEKFKNVQIPKWLLDYMLYFTVLYTLANLYVLVKLWLAG